MNYQNLVNRDLTIDMNCLSHLACDKVMPKRPLSIGKVCPISSTSYSVSLFVDA